MADSLRAMLASAGWRIMRESIDANVALLTEQIVEKVDAATGKEFTDEQVDRLRVRLGYLKELGEMPETMIAGLTSVSAPETNHDPYPTAP